MDTLNKVFYTLKRETSQYNKYMKWHVGYYRDNKTTLASMWFRTQCEAQADVDRSISRGKKGFLIGDRISFTEYSAL